MEQQTKPKLQLSGQDGNVFGIMAAAQRSARTWNKENKDNQLDLIAIQEEALSGDYDHVLQTLMKHFDVS